VTGPTFTGRIGGVPSEVWHDEVLAPQFAYEVEALLPWYVAIEKVILAEYLRMGLATGEQVAPLAARLAEITPAVMRADPGHNMSDIAFAIERHVAGGPVAPFAAWHLDRSRNDLQACAQRMYGRDRLLSAVEALLSFGAAAVRLARRTAELPMPGHTHLQAAQVISPGFYLAAVSAETLEALHRLAGTYRQVDLCPLGAGAMAGQELPWDRDRMAALLGFAAPVPHALVAVASRGWVLSIGADLAGYGVALSRFATDLMLWGTAEFGYLDLPDELSGISSAMPQKKNYPVLERIRGRSGHLVAFGVDLAVGQRNTPYSNSVEVSKEAGAHLGRLLDTLGSTMRLFCVVLDRLEFRADRMREACARDYLGGFTLANLMTLRAGVPWRTAQVIAGRYVVAATERGLGPAQPDGELLGGLAADCGHRLTDPADLLAEAFDVDRALQVKRSPGSANPDDVRRLLDAQQAEYAAVAAWCSGRRAAIRDALAGLDRVLRPEGEPRR
jgi:argininosuccinate lyase